MELNSEEHLNVYIVNILKPQEKTSSGEIFYV